MTIPTENDVTARSAFALDVHPVPRCDAVIAGDKWRITMLTESLVRFEWSDAGRFEDYATQTILNRDLGRTPSYRVTHSRGLTIVDTAALHIVYDGRPFSKEGLSVVVGGMANSQNNTWHYGDVQRGNLKGTARTLDEADGCIPLGDGVISRDGWAVLDDSRSNLIIETNVVNGTPNPFGTWVSLGTMMRPTCTSSATGTVISKRCVISTD
ncbi:alpha-glucosidase [Bifidobacterium hapali]|uniref:Alpha-glucosidase n=1 Tax=Bifidobacterium hapali TaxID=1630172 RepID=A0A261FZX2_9BIFI|nr:alpha-glucosidase [Bifidobacterium hapali]